MDSSHRKKNSLQNSTSDIQRPLTKVHNLAYKDWKKFVPNYFKNCVDIGDWHVIKIQTDGPYFVFQYVRPRISRVQDYEERVLRITLSWPEILEPEGLSQAKMKDLKDFEKFVDPHIENWYQIIIDCL